MAHSYREIGHANCALWTCKQQLALKLRASCSISIVLLETSLYCGFRDTMSNWNDVSIDWRHSHMTFVVERPLL